MIKYINQLFFLFDKKSKNEFPFLILIFIFSSLLDVISIGLIGVFLALLTNSNKLFKKYLFFNHSNISFLQSNELVICFGIFIIFIFISKTFISLMIQKKVVFFCQSVSIGLKERLMSAYQYAPFSYILKSNSSIMMSRIHDNVNIFSLNTLMSLLNFISTILVIMAIVSFLFFLHPIITIILISMFSIIALTCFYFAKIKMILIGEQHSKLNGEIIKSIYHGLHGINEIRIFGRETYFIKSLKKSAENYAYASSMLSVFQLIPRYMIEGMMVVFIITLSFGGIYFNFDTKDIVVIAGIFAAAGTRLLPVVNQFIASLQQIRASHYHGKLIYDDLVELMPSIVNSQLALPNKNKIDFKTIQLSNVTYAYPEVKYPVLSNISIIINKGESIGIIGPSGAGKSTLIHIILGLLEPQYGKLLVNSARITKMREWLNNFAYIPQMIFLSDDTIKRNIAFGIDDAEINDMLVAQAIEMAKLTEVINQLPYGLETVIGENGIRLSGGQRQRIALARALYYDRDIIIMDEATSALDLETEDEVISTIRQLKGKKTVIISSHRQSTIQHCDRTFRVEKGDVTVWDHIRS